MSLPFCWIMYEYCREKLHVYHFWELKGLFSLSLALWTVCILESVPYTQLFNLHLARDNKGMCWYRHMMSLKICTVDVLYPGFN